jgi:transglutaminase-like putative cysteine protease
MKRPLIDSPYPIDRLALILVGAAVFSAAWSVASAEWMPRLDLLGNVVVIGLLLNAVIATRRWRTRTAHIVMLLYGVAVVAWITLDQMPDKIYGWTWLDTLRLMIVRLGEHIWLWFNAIAAGGVGKDNTIFLMFLAAIFWLISFSAAWNTFRYKHMWRAVAPAGVVLLVNTFYYGGDRPLTSLVIVYIFCVLLYAARMYTLSQQQRWASGRVGHSSEIQRDFLRIGSGIAIAAVLFGAVAPTVFGAPQISNLWREISRPLRSVEDSFSRMFSGLEPHGIPYANPFGRTLALLGARTLGNEVVMYVRANTGRYWQAVVYDEYTSNGWQSSESQRLILNPTDPPLTENYDQRVAVSQTFTLHFPNNTLIFAAPDPIAVDRPAWIETFPGTSNVDATIWTSIQPLNDGDSYQVVSSLSTATTDQLRGAGTVYPRSITDRYLQLPNSLPSRVRDLARQIVTKANAANSFDQAAALEAWLRTNIVYNDSISGPQAGQDGVDYVLFDAKKGYCDYYASAMAVMARSLGIPARVATGYASGEYDPKTGLYQVHQYDAHTWVEVYFPQYGWIEFEPTASQPVIVRSISGSGVAGPVNPSGNPASDGLLRFRGRAPAPPEFDPNDKHNGSPSTLNQPATAPTDQTPWATIILAGLMVLLVGTLIAMWLFENKDGTHRSLAGEWAFARMTRMSQWLRVSLSPALTPFEQADRLKGAMPSSAGRIDRVAGLFVREQYGRSVVDRSEARSIWSQLHWQMWWAGLVRRWPRSISLPRRSMRPSLREGRQADEAIS